MDTNLTDNPKYQRILIVDVERSSRRLLRLALSGQYVIFEAENGLSALKSMVTVYPDIVLLDLVLPDMDGLQVIHRLREWTQVPIIILSGRDREVDKVASLNAGADDYLTKPFNTNELIARIRAALRRVTKAESESVYQSDGLIVNLTRREIRLQGHVVRLTPTEFEILKVLVSHAGRVLSHRQLIHAVWGEEKDTKSHLLHVNICTLRRKIEQDPIRPSHIITEPGVGYRFIGESN